MSYCEIPEFFDAQWPVARKQHRCCECGQAIHIGEKHGKFTGKWDGDLSTYRQHLDCEAACVFIRDEFQDGECIGFGQLWEYWQDYSCKGYPRSFEFRKIMARIIRRERRERLVR